jgi:gp6-like head-tail connector protein
MSGLNYSLIVPPTVEPVSLSLAKKQIRVDTTDDNYLISVYISAARGFCETYCNKAFFPQTWQLALDSFPYGDYRTTVPLDQRSPWNYSAYWNDLAIRLPKPTCLGVTSLKYLDAGGTPQTLDPSLYSVDLTSRPARIVPAVGFTWPLTQFYLPGSIQVQFTAGSYVLNLAPESLAVTPVDGTTTYAGILSRQVLSIASVKDTTGTTLAYTASTVLDSNGDPTSQTQLTFTSNPAGGVANVTYQGAMVPPEINMAILLIIGHLYEHREENSEINLKTLPLGVMNFLKPHKFITLGNYESGY